MNNTTHYWNLVLKLSYKSLHTIIPIKMAINQLIGSELLSQWANLLSKSRDIKLNEANVATDVVHPIALLGNISLVLLEQGALRESQIFSQISEICSTSPNYGGLGLKLDEEATKDDIHEISFLISACM